MASIVIEDLSESTELDAAALAAIAGGYVSGFGWIRTFQRVGSFANPVINQYFNLNQYIADEIQIVNQEQYVSISNSAGSRVDLNENGDNGLTRALSLPGLI